MVEKRLSHIISFLPTCCGVISVLVSFENSPTFDRFVYVDLEMKYLVWKLVQHINRRKYQLQESAVQLLQYENVLFCGYIICPQNFECWENQ